MLIIKRYCHNIRKLKSWKEKINDEVYNLSLRVRTLELEREKILADMVISTKNPKKLYAVQKQEG